MNRTIKAVLFWAVILVSALLLWQTVRVGSNPSAGQVSEISYSQFLAQVENGQVGKVSIVGNEVQGTGKSGGRFRVIAPPDHTEMMNALKQHQVEIWFRDASTHSWPAYLLNLAPLVLLAAIWLFMIRQVRSRSETRPEIPGTMPQPPSSSPRFGP